MTVIQQAPRKDFTGDSGSCISVLRAIDLDERTFQAVEGHGTEDDLCLMVQLKKGISSVSTLLVSLRQRGRDPDPLRLGLTQHKAPMWCSAGLIPSPVKIIHSFLISTNCLSLKNHSPQGFWRKFFFWSAIL